jgi:hypothetical protein
MSKHARHTIDVEALEVACGCSVSQRVKYLLIKGNILRCIDKLLVPGPTVMAGQIGLDLLDYFVDEQE